MGGMFQQQSTSEKRIDPNVQKYGNQLLDAMMMAGRVDPRAAAFQGPTVAAMTPAQTAAMDASAAASNAFGIPAVSASQGLPQPMTYDGGLTGYSGAEYALQGMSPQVSQMLDFMYGSGGIMNPTAPQPKAKPSNPTSDLLAALLQAPLRM